MKKAKNSRSDARVASLRDDKRRGRRFYLTITSTRSVCLFLSMSGALAATGPVLANNLAVANTALMSPAAGKVAVRFDISWDNSWRDGVNWDAAWVFVKYSIDGGTNWAHATMATNGVNPAGFTNGTGTNLDIVVPADKKGAFLQRSTNGMGAVANTGLKLLWDFSADGVSRSKSALAKVFAIELVYVPEGAFWAGNTNGVSNSSFRAQADSNSPVYISSTNAFAICYGTGPSTSAVPNTFPNGFAAFYIMKTELPQRQYCDFLNTLTFNQQGNRHDPTLHFNSHRNFIKKTSGSPAVFGCDANNNAGPITAVTNIAKLNETNDGEWVACTWLSWADLAAYADWAALRPMTELEFEKACRGTQAPVANEYAWGNAGLETNTTALIETNTAAEAPNQGNCNYSACSPDGPYRCGSYADASSGRTNAGAGYYGALDLSGSVWERPVTVGNATGLLFTGQHGDGELTAEGEADVTAWPGANAIGAGFRGDSWNWESSWARVSDRIMAAYAEALRSGGYDSYGGRAVRSAP